MSDDLFDAAEKAGRLVSLARRWEEDEEQLKREIGEDESHDGELDAEQQSLAESENRVALQRQQREAEASSRDELWKRGSKLAANLQASAPIREVTSSESPDLDFTELPALLRAREGKLLDSILQTRVDGEDDKRTLRSVETDRLFPASREVEIVLDHLHGIGVRTALPAYRFLATNVSESDRGQSQTE